VNIFKTEFEGLWLLEPKVFEDNRGYFFESYNKRSLHSAGIPTDFIQDNRSRSRKGVFRGLHFQKPPFGQTKLITVLSGHIQDVVLDLRRNQPTYGMTYSVEMSSDNKRQLVIPKGFAHGFLTLSDHADILYKCDEYYHPESESGISYKDPVLKVQWKLPITSMIVSTKDLNCGTFSEATGYY
jgi:dTDP-4-dehydrorhamnose 3,5-epimerase